VGGSEVVVVDEEELGRGKGVPENERWARTLKKGEADDAEGLDFGGMGKTSSLIKKINQTKSINIHMQLTIILPYQKQNKKKKKKTYARHT
jgi:hypothetical protein